MQDYKKEIIANPLFEDFIITLRRLDRSKVKQSRKVKTKITKTEADFALKILLPLVVSNIDKTREDVLRNINIYRKICRVQEIREDIRLLSLIYSLVGLKVQLKSKQWRELQKSSPLPPRNLKVFHESVIEVAEEDEVDTEDETETAADFQEQLIEDGDPKPLPQVNDPIIEIEENLENMSTSRMTLTSSMESSEFKQWSIKAYLEFIVPFWPSFYLLARRKVLIEAKNDKSKC